jgi:protein-disulfide isomerase
MRRALALCTLALAPLLAAPAGGQTTNEDLLREIEALKQGQAELREQVEELKKQLEARAPARPDVAGKLFELGDNPVKGDPSARLVLVEFTDYQ